MNPVRAVVPGRPHADSLRGLQPGREVRLPAQAGARARGAAGHRALRADEWRTAEALPALARRAMPRRTRATSSSRSGRTSCAICCLPGRRDDARPRCARLPSGTGCPPARSRRAWRFCFVPDGDYAGFVEKVAGPQPEGEIVDARGKVLGEHGGVHRFTVGQRKGLAVSSPVPLYVQRIDSARGRWWSGRRRLRAALLAALADWVEGPPPLDRPLRVRIRHRHPGAGGPAGGGGRRVADGARRAGPRGDPGTGGGVLRRRAGPGRRLDSTRWAAAALGLLLLAGCTRESRKVVAGLHSAGARSTPTPGGERTIAVGSKLAPAITCARRAPAGDRILRRRAPLPRLRIPGRGRRTRSPDPRRGHVLYVSLRLLSKKCSSAGSGAPCRLHLLALHALGAVRAPRGVRRRGTGRRAPSRRRHAVNAPVFAPRRPATYGRPVAVAEVIGRSGRAANSARSRRATDAGSAR